MLDEHWSKKAKKLGKVRKEVSSFSAEPAYLYLADYLAKKFKVCRGKLIRLIIADFAHRFITARELDTKPQIRKWYVEVVEREIWGNKRLKIILEEKNKEDKGIWVGIKKKED